MRKVIGSVLVLVSMGFFTVAAAQLPPEVQADAYLLAVEQAIGDGNYDRAWDRLQDIVRLQQDNDLDLPEFHFWYAKAAVAMNLPEQALESVTEYLTAAGRQASHYAEALALLNTLQTTVSCAGWDTDAYYETAAPEQVTACLETGNVDLEAGNASGLTPLQAAATHAEDPAVIQALLDAGAQVEATDTVSGATPLSLAIRDNGTPAIIEVLLAAGSNPKTPNTIGLTPLHLAAQYADDPVVYEMLLTARSGLTTPDQVLEAAERSIEILIEVGADPMHLEQALDSVVRDLAAAGPDGANGAAAQALMERVQTAVRCQGWNTDAYFETATLDRVNACLDTGTVDLEAEDDSRSTPLHLAAAFNGNPAVANTLINAGADLEKQNDAGYSPLHYAAAFNGNPAVVQTLIAAGADPNARNVSGATSLHRAAWSNENPAVVQALLSAGADVEADDNYGYRPLYRAARSNENPAVIEVLIAAGADLEEDAGDDGLRALHLAAENNDNLVVIEALLAAGADPNARDDAGNTPLEAARYNGNPAIREVLLAAEAEQAAAARLRREREANSGPGLFDAAIGILGGTAIAAAGGGTDEAMEAGVDFAESVLAGQQPVGNAGGAATSSGQSSVGTADSGLVGNPGVTVAGGSCEIPGFPNPSDMTNLGLSWCPARVEFQVRVFALQAEGMRCAVAANPSEATPEVVSRVRSQISEVCTRLDALVERLGGPNDCRCPAGFGL